MRNLLRVFILMLVCKLNTAVGNIKHLEAYNQVKAYLQNYKQRTTGRSSGVEEYLQNSNKIGIGYNPLYGSPACYTGECQMKGFGEPIFELKYDQTPKGSCTTKLVPRHVFLDCLPSTEVQAGTDTIDTLESLKESTSKSVDISASGNIWLFSFSYKYSEQTKHMIDNIVKMNSEVLYTSARISYMKLTLFEPFLFLSEPFRYVIENLPCCDYDEVIQQYIHEWIFDHFGFTYVNTLLLGGIARQNIFINKLDLGRLQASGYEQSHEAQVEFYISLNARTKTNYDREKHDSFMKFTKKTSATTLGGDTSIQTIEEWSKTVPSNPIVTKFGIKYIFDLLNRKRFPNDDQILNKSKLIKQAFMKYIDNPIYCYKNCSGNGVCEDSGYFRFGYCKCYTGWKSIDCSLKDISTTTSTTTVRPSNIYITTPYVCPCVDWSCGECIRRSCRGHGRRRRRLVVPSIIC